MMLVAAKINAKGIARIRGTLSTYAIVHPFKERLNFVEMGSLSGDLHTQRSEPIPTPATIVDSKRANVESATARIVASSNNPIVFRNKAHRTSSTITMRGGTYLPQILATLLSFRSDGIFEMTFSNIR
jgi:hypothetical protein